MCGHVACTEEMRSLLRILVRVLEGKRPLQRLRHKEENNIKRDLKGISVNVWTEFNWFRVWSNCGLLSA
jgi:hypothetical protein